MARLLTAAYETLTELTAQEMIGAIVIGMVLGMAGAGICMLVRKRVSDPFPFLCALILVVSAFSMAFGVGFSRLKFSKANGPAAKIGTEVVGPRGIRPDRPLPRPIGRQLLFQADMNGDGHLTPEEAADFVKAVDLTAKGWADLADLDRGKLPPAMPPAGELPKATEIRQGDGMPVTKTSTSLPH